MTVRYDPITNITTTAMMTSLKFIAIDSWKIGITTHNVLALLMLI